MTPSQTKVTKIKVKISTRDKEWFNAENQNLIFEGYLKLWGKTAVNVNNEDEDGGSEGDGSEDRNHCILALKDGDVLKAIEIGSLQKASKGPAPFAQPDLIEKMKENGIGRPSTYGKILDEIMNTDKGKEFIYKANKSGEKVNMQMMTWRAPRKDIKEDVKPTVLNAYKNRLYSSELGKAINNFVDQYFPEIFNYTFTRDLQRDMEEIETGGIKWYKVVDRLYKTFEPKLKQFPKYRTKDDGPNPARKPKRVIGEFEGQTVSVYLAKYGPLIQVGSDEKPRYVKLPKEYSIDTVEYRQIEHLLGFPYDLGHLSDGRTAIVKKSKFGLYVDTGKKNYQLKADMFNDFDESHSMETQIAKMDLELIEASIAETDKPKSVLRDVEGIQIIEGKFGPYFIHNGTLVGIPKIHNINLVTYKDLMQMYQNKSVKKSGGAKKKLTLKLKPK